MATTRKAEVVKAMEVHLAKKQRMSQNSSPVQSAQPVNNVNVVGPQAAVHPPSPMVNLRPNLGKRKAAVEFRFRDWARDVDIVNGLETLLQKDREQIHVKRGIEPLTFDGVPWAPNWKVTADSSIFESDFRDTSNELYRACMLPRDKAMFVRTPHPEVEEFGAQNLMQVAICMHHLSLSCSYWKNETLLLDQKLAKSMDRIAGLEADLCDAKETSENLCKSIRKEKQVAYSAGLEAGKTLFLKKDEYQNFVAQHRLNGPNNQLGCAPSRRRKVDKFGEEGEGSSYVVEDVVPLQTAVHSPSPTVNPRPNLGKRNAVEFPFRACDRDVDFVNSLETLLQNDRDSIHVLSRKEPLAFDGVPWAPNWKVSADSSILESDFGDTSYELYKGCMLPRDKAMFVYTSHAEVEEFGAQNLMQVGISMHQLSLSCSHWKNGKLLLDQKLAKYMDRIARLEADLCDAKETSKNLSENLQDAAALYEKLHSLHTREISEKENECSDQGKKVNELQQYLVDLRGSIEKEKQIAYSAGLMAGKAEFLKSDEYQNLVAQHRLNGARDFKRSTIFHQILIEKAASDTLIGFDKCKKLLISLKGIKDDFDLSRLNPCVISDSASADEEEEEDGEEEPPINFEEFKELAPVE